MKWLSRVAAGAVCCAIVFVSDAHEVDVHMLISDKAVDYSIALQPYLSASGLTVESVLTDVNSSNSIRNWIIYGARDEDDTISTNFARYRHHFFDVQNGGAGYSYGVLSGEPSVDWGLEDLRSFGSQQYSLKSARKYFYEALTVANKDNREMFLARTFYTLGHVIHLVQDLSQPQHVRNDSHGGGIFGTRSRYEHWTDKLRKASKLDRYFSPGFDGGRLVAFDSARGFWAEPQSRAARATTHTSMCRTPAARNLRARL